MKTGIQTSEFWLTSAGSLVLLALSSGVIPHGQQLVSVWNSVCDAVSALGAAALIFGYNWGRTLQKTKSLEVSPSTAVTPAANSN